LDWSEYSTVTRGVSILAVFGNTFSQPTWGYPEPYQCECPPNQGCNYGSVNSGNWFTRWVDGLPPWIGPFAAGVITGVSLGLIIGGAILTKSIVGALIGMPTLGIVPSRNFSSLDTSSTSKPRPIRYELNYHSFSTTLIKPQTRKANIFYEVRGNFFFV